MSGIVLSAKDLNSFNADEIVKYNEKVIDEISIDIDDQTCKNQNQNHISTENQSIPNRQRSPTQNSIDSNNISIVTLDENEDDSSVIDSDSDAEEIPNCIDNQYKASSGIVLVNKNIEPPNLCQSSVLCANDDKPNIGSIAVQNSSDITFGNKTFYQGPVTIKQFVYEKNKWTETESNEKDNLGFVNNNADNININLNRTEKGNSPLSMQSICLSIEFTKYVPESH